MKSRKILFNTGILYSKSILSIVISLYSTRLVLQALGVEDYGIYNLLVGVISMFAFLKTSMSLSTQRYLSYAMGKAETVTSKFELRSIFQSSVLLHMILASVVFLVLEIGGIGLLNGILNIPANKIEPAKIVFHLMAINAFITINSVPYEGLLNANQNMLVIAIVGIFEVLLKLLLAISLGYTNNDKLIYYAAGMLLISVLSRVSMTVYCRSNYPESRGSVLRCSNSNVRSMFSFAAWNSFGSLCSIGRTQGIAVILNLFHGVVVNAAYGISSQVNAQLNYFSQSLIMSFRPEIVKKEGEGKRQEMVQLSFVSSKLSFFLLSFIAVPLLLEMQFVMETWLGRVPDYTIVFASLTIILCLIIQLSVGLVTAIQAAGKIKKYQSTVGSFILLTIPLSYLVLVNDFPAYSVLVVSIAVEIVATIIRLSFASFLLKIKSSDFFKKVVFRSVLPVVIVFPICKVSASLIMDDMLRFCYTVGSSSFLLFGTIYLIGLTASERVYVSNFIGKFKKIK